MSQDNSTLRRKVLLRRTILRAMAADGITPVVLEPYGGWGHIFQQCYRDVPQGCVIEKDNAKAYHLAAQRPTWAVYQGEAVGTLAAGGGAHLAVNLLDLDPYGECWPALRAFLTSDRPRVPVLHLVVNDGTRQKLQRSGGWDVHEFQQIVATMGNDLAPRYLEICQLFTAKMLTQAGYRLSHWAGYYCGFQGQMTHFHAIGKRD